jgi:hypothetical protein
MGREACTLNAIVEAPAITRCSRFRQSNRDYLSSADRHPTPGDFSGNKPAPCRAFLLGRVAEAPLWGARGSICDGPWRARVSALDTGNVLHEIESKAGRVTAPSAISWASAWECNRACQQPVDFARRPTGPARHAPAAPSNTASVSVRTTCVVTRMLTQRK